MFKGFIMFVFGIMVGIFATSQCSGPEQQSWVPVFEDTGFVYFDDILDASIDELNSGSSAAKVDLRTNLVKLKQFYIPMTKVRQLVFDADRLLYLDENTQALKKLEEANSHLKNFEKDNRQNGIKPASELILMIDELILGINNEDAGVNQKFRSVGRRINLMLVKGELVLSDVRF